MMHVDGYSKVMVELSDMNGGAKCPSAKLHKEKRLTIEPRRQSLETFYRGLSTNYAKSLKMKIRYLSSTYDMVQSLLIATRSQTWK